MQSPSPIDGKAAISAKRTPYPRTIRACRHRRVLRVRLSAFLLTKVTRDEKMAKMNYKQIEHCQQRLHALRCSKVGKTPEKPRGPHEDKFLREIADGTRRIQPAVLRQACDAKSRNNNGYKDLEDYLIEICYEKDNAKALLIYEDRTDKYNAVCKRVDTEVTRIEDEIVLGDQQAAMALLKAFELWKL